MSTVWKQNKILFFLTIFLPFFFYNEYGDIMRKYYLFIINNDYYKNYKKNSKVLYNTLYNLYTLDKKNFTYGISLYNSVCQIVSKNLLIPIILFDYYRKQRKPSFKSIILVLLLYPISICQRCLKLFIFITKKYLYVIFKMKIIFGYRIKFKK